MSTAGVYDWQTTICMYVHSWRLRLADYHLRVHWRLRLADYHLHVHSWRLRLAGYQLPTTGVLHLMLNHRRHYIA